MSFGETPITIIGNLTADPEVKVTESGQALARFTVASTPRMFDRESNQWKDGSSTFFRCTAWRALAEHVADSLTKGSRVVLSGRIRQHDWKTPEGENRSMLAVEVDEIGASLRFTTVTINGKHGALPDSAWTAEGNSSKPPF
ncbi:single-stranded DNA-binding protein [Streptomyces cylindrosporus]|uniref:Single-stranded DNA-binding protein n=1 Tax=Streptomyces cylindrosporus TaxID=2927583 RepID=A0ABS9YGG1_9ACTN|nr:single-stranded DNA-binding protein [Streptomyces cylindrosporus]MCI3276285.1 single-stranded DNA-binding protein [Streptomyces cylindrosporus]